MRIVYALVSRPYLDVLASAHTVTISDGASKEVLNVLKSVYRSLRKVRAQRVTVVEFEMYNRSVDGVGCFEIKVGANAAQLTNVIVAGPRQ